MIFNGRLPQINAGNHSLAYLLAYIFKTVHQISMIFSQVLEIIALSDLALVVCNKKFQTRMEFLMKQVREAMVPRVYLG